MICSSPSVMYLCLLLVQFLGLLLDLSGGSVDLLFGFAHTLLVLLYSLVPTLDNLRVSLLGYLARPSSKRIFTSPTLKITACEGFSSLLFTSVV